MKFCRTDTGYNSGNSIVNRNTIFKITILLQEIEMCFPEILYIFPTFCTRNNGWGWDNFIREANAGEGIAFPRKMRFYMSKILPWIIVVIYLKGYYDLFRPQGLMMLTIWMAIALLFLAFVGSMIWKRPKQK